MLIGQPERRCVAYMDSIHYRTDLMQMMFCGVIRVLNSGFFGCGSVEYGYI